MITKGKAILATLMLTSGFTVVAQASDVSCPSTSDVKGAVKALNGVIRQSQKSYIVLTAQPAFSASGHEWLLMTQSQGNGFDDALRSGGNDVQSVMMPASPNAIEMQGVYVCPYVTSNGGMNVMAISPQQQDARSEE